MGPMRDQFTLAGTGLIKLIFTTGNFCTAPYWNTYATGKYNSNAVNTISFSPQVLTDSTVYPSNKWDGDGGCNCVADREPECVRRARNGATLFREA